MNLIEISSIVYNERQRKELDHEAIGELAASIVEVGLINPITLQDDGFTLAAGERRIAAIKFANSMGWEVRHGDKIIPPGHVPYLRTDDLTPEQYFQLELDENLHRKGLTVLEESAAIAKLHKMRKAANPQHTAKDTQQELREKHDYKMSGSLNDYVIIDENKDIPGVAKAKTPMEAMKIIGKHKQAEYREQLSKEFEAVKESKHILHHGDCLTYMQGMEVGSVDVICTDPPYGIDAANFGSQSQARHHYEDGEETWEYLMGEFLCRAYQICKDKAHAYVFCAYEKFEHLQRMAEIEGWTPWPRPFIWNKSNGMLPKPEHGPRYTYECVLFLNKGNKKVQFIEPDVISISGVQAPRHGAEKPVELYTNLLRRSALPGDLVADFFAGTGPIIKAADELHCRAIAVEKSDEYFGIMVEDNSE